MTANGAFPVDGAPGSGVPRSVPAVHHLRRARTVGPESGPAGPPVRIECRSPVFAAGVERMLEGEFRVYHGQGTPEDGVPFCVVLCADDTEGLAEAVGRARRSHPDVPVLVFGPRADLSLAYAALKAGARGFVHAGMAAGQIVRALKVASEGEIVAPRELLEYVVTVEDQEADLSLLSPRQREILDLVGEGLTNAQIAKRLFLTESTIKQHLRAVYKLLGVKNRTQAARLVRNDH